MVTAFVSNNYAPQKPTVVADTFACYSSGKSFTLGASGNDTIRWYNQPTAERLLLLARIIRLFPAAEVPMIILWKYGTESAPAAANILLCMFISHRLFRVKPVLLCVPATQ